MENPSSELKSSVELAAAKVPVPEPTTPARPAPPAVAPPVIKSQPDQDRARMAAVVQGTAAKTFPLSSIQARMPAPRPAAPLLIAEATLVEKYLDQVATAEQLSALRTAAVAVAKEQSLIESHSPVIWEQHVREAVLAYANDPRTENLKRMREAKSITGSEHAVIQSAAVVRKARAIIDQVMPAARPIFTALAELLEAKADQVEAVYRDQFAEFELVAPPHSLAVSLRALASNLRAQIGAKAAPSELPELVAAILRR